MREIGDLKAFRKSLGLNQIKFWNPLGVSQSGGSRYEQGRNVPKPVLKLVYIHHVQKLDVTSEATFRESLVSHLEGQDDGK